MKIDSAISHVYADEALAGLTRSEFFDSLAGGGLSARDVRSLPDPIYYALLDTHEQRQASGEARVMEKVSVQDTANAHSKRIYQTFFDQAQLRAAGERPNIVVVTASSRDPFEVVDFYAGVFESLGASVSWLPLSAAYQQATSLERLGASGCDLLPALRARFDLFDRERIYPQRTAQQMAFCRQPEKVQQVLNQAHGIFFNGGDQSKTLAALLTPEGEPSPALQTIRERMKQGSLIVGGTSAGTAVQAGGSAFGRPVPMLSNGDPAGVMARGIFAVSAPSQRCSSDSQCDSGLLSGDVTVRGEGGSGLFQAGLLDTHFSERDRETRLIVATLFSQQRLGFGVDETTALLVRYEPEATIFKTIGANGVFVADLTDNEWQQSQQGGTLQRKLAGFAHYWAAGTVASLTNGQWQVKLADSEQEPMSLQDENGRWRAEVSRQCRGGNAINWQQFGNDYLLVPSKQTAFAVNSNGRCSYQNLPFVIQGPY